MGSSTNFMSSFFSQPNSIPWAGDLVNDFLSLNQKKVVDSIVGSLHFIITSQLFNPISDTEFCTR